MSKYSVELAPLARKQFLKLSTQTQKQIQKVIDALASDPRPHGYKKLIYFDDYFRVRSGNYRIIYQIVDTVLTVTIIEVKRRNESTY